MNTTTCEEVQCGSLPRENLLFFSASCQQNRVPWIVQTWSLRFSMHRPASDSSFRRGSWDGRPTVVYLEITSEDWPWIFDSSDILALLTSPLGTLGGHWLEVFLRKTTTAATSQDLNHFGDVGQTTVAMAGPFKHVYVQASAVPYGIGECREAHGDEGNSRVGPRERPIGMRTSSPMERQASLTHGKRLRVDVENI